MSDSDFYWGDDSDDSTKDVPQSDGFMPMPTGQIPVWDAADNERPRLGRDPASALLPAHQAFGRRRIQVLLNEM